MASACDCIDWQIDLMGNCQKCIPAVVLERRIRCVVVSVFRQRPLDVITVGAGSSMADEDQTRRGRCLCLYHRKLNSWYYKGQSSAAVQHNKRDLCSWDADAGSAARPSSDSGPVTIWLAP